MTIDRTPGPQDNPRHAAWIDDERGLRLITVATPGHETINIDGVAYQHTRDITPKGRWVYAKVSA